MHVLNLILPSTHLKNFIVCTLFIPKMLISIFGCILNSVLELIVKLIVAHTHSLTYSLPPSLTHSLTRSLTHSLTHSLTDHIHKPRGQLKQRTATISCHNNKLTSGICLMGFRRVCALHALSFLLLSIKLLVFFFIQRNHIEALIFHINTFFKQHNRCHKII